MGGFDNYLQKQEQQKDSTIYTEQKRQGLPAQESQRLSDQELIDKYETRISEESSFEERTRYYFEDNDLMTAKAERYKTISKDKISTGNYGETYRNLSAKKRRDAAADASKSFAAAAKLQKKTPADAKGHALYKHREKIIRLRMEGMIYAAQVKSQSKEDEKYRILKAKLSCLSILKDQLEHLELEATEAEAVKFTNERAKLEKEIESVKNDLQTQLPSAQKKWEDANNFEPDEDETIEDKMFEKLKTDYESYERHLQCYGYAVKRDAQGKPINKTEEKKDKWNKKLAKAIKDEDQATVSAMRVERLKRLENLKLPTPSELKKKGIEYYVKKDPALYYEFRLLDDYNLDTFDDPVLKDFVEKHPDIMSNYYLARHLGHMAGSLGQTWSIRDQWHKYNMNYEDRTTLTEEEKKTAKDSKIKDQKTKDRTREEQKREKAAKETSVDAVRSQMQDGKVVAPEDSKDLKEYAAKVTDLYNFLGNKMPALEFGDEAVDTSTMVVTTLYNDVVSSINTCLSKTEQDGITEVVRAQLNKVKNICEEERRVFKQKVGEYRQMLSKYGGATEAHTWYDALKYGRAVIYNLNRDKKVKTKRLGEQSSTVYKFTTAENGQESSVFFRKSEVLGAADDATLTQNFFNNLQADDAFKQSVLKPLFDAILEDAKGRVGGVSFSSFYMKLVTEGKEEGVLNKLAKTRSKTKDVINGMTEADKQKAEEYAMDFCRHVAQREYAGNANIDPGSNMTDRNVATSRMAQILGIKENICESKTAVVIDGENATMGNVMEETGGKSYQELKEENPEAQITYSTKAISQLFSLQIFDSICGQIDRHFGNFHFRTIKDGGNIVMDHVRGLDNDLSFGKLLFKNIKPGYDKMKPIISANLKAIPIQMINSIMQLDEKFVRLSLCDILKNDELDALWDRITGIKDEIRKIDGIKEKDGRYFYEGEDADDTLRQLKQLKQLSQEDGDEMSRSTLFDTELLRNTNLDRMIEDRRNEIS